MDRERDPALHCRQVWTARVGCRTMLCSSVQRKDGPPKERFGGNKAKGGGWVRLILGRDQSEWIVVFVVKSSLSHRTSSEWKTLSRAFDGM